MRGFMAKTRIAVAIVIAALPAVVRAQLSETAAFAAQLQNQYRVIPNITYLTANNWEAKLDVYLPREVSSPNPTLLYIHGGGWTGGSKEGSVLTFLPYLEMGWSVVNVEYRLARVSLAPAAVEDCRCALRWVIAHAKEYGFDAARLVVTGGSAGGHLSLTTGMLPASAGLERQCPGNEELKVSGIGNWYGLTDGGGLLDRTNMKTYAGRWLGRMRNGVARR